MTKPTAFHRLLDYALADRRALQIALLLLFTTTVADITGPLLIKHFIDQHVVPANWQASAMITITIAYLSFMLLAAISNYYQSVRFSRIAIAAVQTLRQQVFDKLLSLPVSYFDSTPTGSLISRLTNDTEAIKDLYLNVLSVVIQNLMRILGILIAMAVLDWRLMVICLIFVPIVITLMLLYRRLSSPIFHRARTLLSDINTRLHECIQGMRVIQLFGQTTRFRREFGKLVNEHQSARLRNVRLDSILLRPMVDLIQLTLLVALLFSFGVDALAGPVEIGVIYAFVAYLGRFGEPLVEITQRLSLYQQAIVAGERVFELLDSPCTRQPASQQAAVTQGTIEVRELSFSYDGQREVLHDINFAIPAGGFYAIVGHTGSGKSTLSQLLLRFYHPQHGEIRLDGHPLASLSEEALRQAVCIVQQEPFIRRGSVRDNITQGLDIDQATVINTAKLIGLHDHVMQLPQGYDTPLLARGSNLSVGQRQLLALARTLVRTPKILILDEATANIDSQTEAVIQNALLRLHGRVTLLIIAHRLSTIEKADQILVLHHGHLCQQGNHQQLLAVDGIYRQLYEMQKLSVDD